MSENKGMKAFLAVAIGLFLLRLLLPVVLVPPVLAAALSVVMTLVFIGLPIYAMYRAAHLEWESRPALVLLAVGALMHVAGALGSGALPIESYGTVVVHALGQTGILVWTLGLGVLLALFIKDKNLMIPVAIFLIGLDMFLVFNPSAPTAFLMQQGSIDAQRVLMSVPAVKTTGDTLGEIQSLAYVGPADLLFSAAFFAMLFRFQMRTKQTFVWLVPVLFVYLGIVIFFGTESLGPLSLSMLPAMVPIGLTVLLVNIKEFKLKGQELVGVFIVAAMAFALAWYGVFRASLASNEPKSITVPVSEGQIPELPTQEGSTETVP